MASKSSSGKGAGATQDATQRVRDLNDRIIENARKAGGTYLDIYERTLKMIVGYQEEMARATPVDWVQRMIEAQATFTREVGNFYASSAREAIKK
ncbi:MAG: hypothetical protein JOZ73_00930 [Solirubrobacterales bacterium]|nr:hypothetical protein [Solirubrobacterales bacterium]